MADVVDAETRSRMMAGIRGRDTQPEMEVRRKLHAAGYRYSLQRRDLPGRPDIVLTKHKLAVFVHGCFWHRHPGCRFASVPSTRTDFWAEKFATNVKRDQRNVLALVELGWRVAVIWECGVRADHNRMLAWLESMIAGRCADFAEWPVAAFRPSE